MRDRLRRLAEALLRIWPLTGAGNVLVLALPALAAFAWQRLDRVAAAFSALLGVALLLQLAAVIVATLMLRRRERARPPTPRHLTESVPARTGFRVSLPAWLPTVTVSWTWVEPPAEAGVDPRRDEERVRPLRRGERSGVLRRFEVADALGWCRTSFVAEEPGHVVIDPSPGHLRQVPSTPGWSDGDDLYDPMGRPAGDPLDLRPYVPGDPIRFILWKVYARTRKVIVRAPERAVTRVQEVVCWLVAGPHDDAAAAAAWVAVSSGDLGSRWTLGADGVPGRARGLVEAQDLLRRSASCPADVSGTGLAAFLDQAGPGRRAVVLVPATAGPWVEQVVRAVGTSAVPCDVVVCFDGRRRAAQEPWWQAGEPAPDVDPLPVVQALAGARAPIFLLDRQTGTWMSGEQLAQRAEPAA